MNKPIIIVLIIFSIITVPYYVYKTNFSERKLPDLAKAPLDEYDGISINIDGEGLSIREGTLDEEESEFKRNIVFELLRDTKLVPANPSSLDINNIPSEYDSAMYVFISHKRYFGRNFIFEYYKNVDGKDYLVVDRTFSKGFVPEIYLVSGNELYKGLVELLEENK